MDTHQKMTHGNQRAIYYATLSSYIGVDTPKSMEPIEVQFRQLKTNASMYGATPY